MKIEDYEKYYQKGGSYVIPTEVFNELFNELEAWKKQAKKVEMIRLNQTKKVFDTIANIIKEGSCSYRHLIYDKLGFDGEYYEELISGMAITNAICDLEELREQHEEDLNEIEKLTSIWKTKNEEISKLKEEIKAVNKGLKKVRERASKYKYKSLDLQKENQELKKQLMLSYCGLLTQQKEFIKYLEEEIKTLEKDIIETVDDMDIYMKQVKSLIIEEILQKYKEIIGVSDENNKQ